MKNAIQLLLWCLIWASCQHPVQSQTFLGRTLINSQFEYTKIEWKDQQWVISFPFSPTLDSYQLLADPRTNATFSANIKDETWAFSSRFLDQSGELHLDISSGIWQQQCIFYLQQKAVDKASLPKYAGTYIDEHQNVVIINQERGRLSMISPYSKESFSLKPIGKNEFWSSSGERWKFEEEQNSVFSNLIVKMDQGKSIHLKRKQLFTEKEVWISHLEDTLYGKLFLAESQQLTPACLILQGGGSAGLANYEFEARYLAANGITSLLCNKAGEGRSKGPSHFTLQSFEEKTREYLSLFHFLRDHPKVNPEKVGVHGVSEGGRLALLMAIDLQDTLAFTIAGAAPIMTMKEGQLYAMDHYHRNLGISETDNLNIQYTWNRYYNGIISGNIDPYIIDQANNFRALHRNVFLPPNSTIIPGSPRADDLTNDRIVTEANKITSPVLLQYGENDQRVHPYKSLENFSKNIDQDLKWKRILYPRANHSYMTPEFKISTAYLQDKLGWIRACIQ